MNTNRKAIVISVLAAVVATALVTGLVLTYERGPVSSLSSSLSVQTANGQSSANCTTTQLSNASGPVASEILQKCTFSDGSAIDCLIVPGTETALYCEPAG